MEPTNTIELSELRNRTQVFQDPEHAGRVLEKMLKAHEETLTMVLAIPVAGVPITASETDCSDWGEARDEVKSNGLL